MLQFTLSDANGKTSISAFQNEVKVAEVSLPTPAFDVLSLITEPTPNKIVQQKIAEACGWSLNAQGRCPKAAALLERITPGYGAFNGTIAIMVGTSQDKNRYFHFNESLTPSSRASMLSRKKSAE